MVEAGFIKVRFRKKSWSKWGSKPHISWGRAFKTENNWYKGPDVGQCLSFLGNGKEASAAIAWGKVAVCEVWEVTLLHIYTDVKQSPRYTIKWKKLDTKQYRTLVLWGILVYWLIHWYT